MSWESTATYYQLLNRYAREALGGRHSAKMVIWSFDFAPIADLQAAGRWPEAGALLADAARKLEDAGAEAIVICANTMHLLADEVQAAVTSPVIHVADATARQLQGAGVKRPLMLATRFTMEKPFYLERLAMHGIEAIVPSERDRTRLHDIIFDELVQGRLETRSRLAVSDIAREAVAMRGVDGIILGCTEFGLLVGPADFDAPVFDTTEIHARAAMDFALGLT